MIDAYLKKKELQLNKRHQYDNNPKLYILNKIYKTCNRLNSPENFYKSLSIIRNAIGYVKNTLHLPEPEVYGFLNDLEVYLERSEPEIEATIEPEREAINDLNIANPTSQATRLAIKKRKDDIYEQILPTLHYLWTEESALEIIERLKKSYAKSANLNNQPDLKSLPQT